MKMRRCCQVADKLGVGQYLDKYHGTDGLLRVFCHFIDAFFDIGVSPRYNPRLMSGQHQRLPLEVDPFRLAAREEHLQGAISLKQMKRLSSALSSDEGDVLVDVIFSVDLNRVVLLSGTIQTETKLICQRCMEEMDLPIKLDFQLAFARSEAEMERLPEGYEVTLIEDTPMMLSDIIEDEILLALPPIPKHLDDTCSSDNIAKGWDSQQTTEPNTENVKQDNPFNVLASLKTDK